MKLRENLVPAPKTEDIDREAWSGLKAYKCYCCHDTGYVVRIERVLKNPHLFSRPILCQRTGCTASQAVQDDPSIVDTRLTPSECQQLHEITKEDWLKSEAQWHEQRQETLLAQMSAQATKRIKKHEIS